MLKITKIYKNDFFCAVEKQAFLTQYGSQQKVNEI